MNQQDKDNHSNMLNPNNEAYWKSRGYLNRPNIWEAKPPLNMNRTPYDSDEDETNYGNSAVWQENDDNKANQKNPNHWAFWKSRGFDERPADWMDRIKTCRPLDNKDGDNKSNNVAAAVIGTAVAVGVGYSLIKWFTASNENENTNGNGNQNRTNN